jgi:diguanylate cyclase (GGDEF)-like protein/PAS domain S-box-containing protein
VKLHYKQGACKSTRDQKERKLPLKLKYWISLGMYKEEDDRRNARVLMGFILVFALTSLLLIVFGFILGDTSLNAPLALGATGMIVPLIFLLRGKLSASNFLTIGLSIFFVTLFSTFGYGLRDYAILGYPAAIVFAGLVKQRRGLVVSTLLTIVSLTWLVLGEKYGLIIVPEYYHPSWLDVFLSSQGILLTAVVVDLLVTNLKERLTQLRLELAQRKQAEEALNLSRSLIQSINNNLVSGMIYQIHRDKDGARKFTYVSNAVRKFYGVDPLEAMKNPNLIYAKVHPEDRVRIYEEEEKAYRTMSVFRTEARVINPDGSVRWSSFISNPQSAEGGSSYWDGIELDITEGKRAEETLQQANVQLSAHLEEIQILQAKLNEQILRDPLTDLYNRRYLDEALRHEVSRAEREEKPFSLIVIDIDHFKRINDTYGHPVGDLFLVQIGNMLKQHIRGMDTACRFGGEEFLLMLPGADTADAFHRAEEIRLKCADINIHHEGHDLSVTISLGIAAYPTHGSAADKLLIKADKAMYRSKRNGRNRTTVWEETEIKIS